MKEETKKVYIAKYALTKGIAEANAYISKCWWNMKIEFAQVYGYRVSLEIGKDAFYSKEEVVKKAEKMRASKIKSLKKQIEKLEGLKFE